MRLPIIHGLIRRRLLVNFRVDAEVMGRFLPVPFLPKLHRGYAIAGICLIRLEQIRPAWLPRFSGISSENAAHRIAVLWDEPSGESREGVFIPRRDTGSWLNHFAGGRIFPGEHHLADFAVTDDGSHISMSIRARDRRMAVQLCATRAIHCRDPLASGPWAESSAFFEGGSVGYSVTRDCRRLDGIRLQTDGWQVRPLAVEHVESSFFANESHFQRAVSPSTTLSSCAISFTSGTRNPKCLPNESLNRMRGRDQLRAVIPVAFRRAHSTSVTPSIRGR